MTGFYRGPQIPQPRPGTLRCSICSINYPPQVKFQKCPVCGVPTDRFGNVMPDEDWLELAESMAKVIDGEIPDYPPTA